jgi:hypothetical protein
MEAQMETQMGSQMEAQMGSQMEAQMETQMEVQMETQMEVQMETQFCPRRAGFRPMKASRHNFLSQLSLLWGVSAAC